MGWRGRGRGVGWSGVGGGGSGVGRGGADILVRSLLDALVLPLRCQEKKELCFHYVLKNEHQDDMLKVDIWPKTTDFSLHGSTGPV